MIEEAPYVGGIDFDSPNHVIDQRFVRDAWNIVWRGIPGRMRAESVPGVTAIPNPFLPITGTNKGIGGWYDPVNQNLYTFNYNSLGAHGIYILNTLTKTWLRLIEVGVNTSGDPLAFTPSGRIMGTRMIYGDATDGNLLFYTDSLKRPTKINVDRFLNTPYNTVIRNYMKVIKAPPVMPPRVVYENDTTVNANNLLNSLFQFTYSFIYDDNEESVVASASVTPLPVNAFTNTDNVDKSKDARIAIYLQTGDQNVKSIRIYMRQTQYGIKSNWFIVDTIPKLGNGISNNGIYRFEFFNDSNYTPADPKFTTLLFDYTPPEANSQELLNGTTISYGGIREGYDWFKSMFSVNTGGQGNSVETTTINGFLFFADYNGGITGSQRHVEFFVTGAGTNNGSGEPTDLTYAAQDFYFFADSNGSDIGFLITNNINLNIVAIFNNIKAVLVAAGWTFVSQSTNSVVFYFPVGTVNVKSTLNFGATPFVNNFFRLAHYPQSNYSYGLVYEDEDGRTNGTITDVSGNVTTLPYYSLGSATYTEFYLNLNGIIPPSWARSYNIVRTNTLTYNKYLNWISIQAFSNVNTLAINKYAYIGISNIDDFNATLRAVDNPVGYEFSQGDRIRFVTVYRLDGAVVPVNKDYQILGLAVNPLIDGTAQEGRFIQIAYPASDIGINFRFDGDPSYQNYLVEIYNVASNASPQTLNSGQSSENGNVYYMAGGKFGIGNPGLNTAYHFGNFGIPNQGNNQVRIEDGDIYFRQRTIPIGNVNYIDVTGLDKFSNRYSTPLITLAAPIVTPQYTLDSENKLAASESFGSYPRFSDGGGVLLNTSGNTLQIRIRGTQQVSADHPTWMDIKVKICNPDNTTGTIVTILHESKPISTLSGTLLDIEFDGTFGVPAGAKMWLLFGNGLQVIDLHTQPFQMRLDIVRNQPIFCFDKSFSDVFNLVTNSDNRPTVQDTTAKDTYFSTLFRYSQAYQLGTNINNTNRFYPNNFDEFDKSYGDIMRMRARQRDVRIFQKRRCGHIGVYARFIQSNDGNSNLVTTDGIITPNNIEYFEGEYGLGNQPDSLSSSGFQDYFIDPVKGYALRLSLDGIKPISEEGRVQTFFGATAPSYLKNYAYPLGGTAVILGAYNFCLDRPSEAIFVFQAGTLGSATLQGQAIAFKEQGNAWTSRYNFAPDAIACCENVLYSCYNGIWHTHDNTTIYANFYGTQYKPSLTIVKNNQPLIKKTWIGISEVSNVKWNIPLLYTETESYAGQRQESNIIDNDLKLIEGQYHASFLRDVNSIGGINNGQSLKGTFMVMQLTVTNGDKFSYLSDAAVKYIISSVLQK